MSTGIFSSRVTADSGSEVLINARYCGDMPSTFSDDIVYKATAWTLYYSALSQKASEYLTYTHRCYQNRGAEIPDDCKVYEKPFLPYSRDANASCPFDKELCVLPHGNLFLDTGYLDSNEHFGINTGPKFKFRLKRHCAPLETNGYTQVNASDPDNTWMEYYYGPSYAATTLRPYSHRVRMNVTSPLNDWEDLRSTDNYKIT